MQESCDLGNNSDITEERDESKAQIPWSARVVISSAQEDGSEPRVVCLSEEMLEAKPRDNMPKSFDDTGYNNQNSKPASTPGFLGQENSNSLLKGNQKEIQENCHSQPPDQHHHGPRRHDFPDLNLKPTDSFPADVYNGLPRKDAGRNNSDLYELVSHDQSRELSAVLESLKQAKLCLQQEINKLPLVDRGYTGKAIKTPALVSKTEDKFEIPGVRCSSLFRLPADFFDEETARFNFHDSSSGFSSNFYPGRDISRISGGQFGTNPYSGTMLSSSANNQSFATRYTETGSRFDTKRVPSGPFLDEGLFSSGKYLNPTTHPISYQNAKPPMSFGEGLSSPYSSSTAGVPPAYQFSFHGDH